MINISGLISIPGDKGISHRALMLGSLTDGKSIINNIATGRDVESTRICLYKCGIVSKKQDSMVQIFGGTLKTPTELIYCGNSGTTVRLLAGLLAGQGISADFSGDRSLCNRPMDRIIDPLSNMGANFKARKGCLPFSIRSNNLKAITYNLPVASAQVKSAVLLAGLGTKGNTIVSESIKTRDHTEIMLSELGADIKIGDKIKIAKLKKPLNKFEMDIPGDPSSAAFFAGLAAVIPNSDLRINNILANPTRIGVFKVFEKMGVGIQWINIKKKFDEWVGDLRICSQNINGIDITKEMVPSIIDEIPIIAVIASQADSPTTVSGATELRFKETDRIKAICINLSKMGCEIIEKRDGFIINPINKLYNTDIKTFGDHRIAMAFIIAGYFLDKQNRIDDLDCINISFPEFFTQLELIIHKS